MPVMKIGDVVKLHSSTRRNGKFAGQVGLIVSFDKDRHASFEVNVGGEIINFHMTQIEEIIND